jgi:hypothetical protein
MCPQRGKMGGVSFTKKKRESSLWARLFVAQRNTANLYFLSYSISLVIPLEICDVRLTHRFVLVQTLHENFPGFCRNITLTWSYIHDSSTGSTDGIVGARLWHGKCDLQGDPRPWTRNDRIELIVSVEYGMVFLRYVAYTNSRRTYLSSPHSIVFFLCVHRCSIRSQRTVSSTFLPRDKNNKSLDRIWHTFSQLYDPWSRKRWPSIADLMSTLFLFGSTGYVECNISVTEPDFVARREFHQAFRVGSACLRIYVIVSALETFLCMCFAFQTPYCRCLKCGWHTCECVRMTRRMYVHK